MHTKASGLPAALDSQPLCLLLLVLRQGPRLPCHVGTQHRLMWHMDWVTPGACTTCSGPYF